MVLTHLLEIFSRIHAAMDAAWHAGNAIEEVLVVIGLVIVML